MRKVAQCHFFAFVSLAVTGLGICAGSSKGVLTFPLGLLILLAVVVPVFAQDSLPNSPEAKQNNQINVNWLYGSYVPKEVPLASLDSKHRFKLYLRQTYTGFGIYVKTTLFTVHDQIHKTYPEWGNGFDSFAKRFGTRQAEFVVQNSVIALGDGVLGWEPRYDRCRCSAFWPRTRHAMVRNFVTYDRTEKSLRPQLFPYVGAFAGNVTGTAWEPGHVEWQVKGAQAVITQIPVGMGINFLAEFAPEITRVLKRKH